MGAFTTARELLPTLEKRAKNGHDREGSPLLVLGRPGLESDEASVPIHLGPHQREHLGAAPSGHERKADTIRHIWLETSSRERWCAAAAGGCRPRTSSCHGC